MYLKNLSINNFFLFILFCILTCSKAYSSEEFNYFSFINNLNSFSASFKQDTYKIDGSLFSESSGNILYKKEAKYILDYKSPNKIKFISDGQFITTYDEDLEQAIIQNYGNKFKENIIDVMTDELLIKEKFSLKHYIEERDHHIKFLPIKSDIENNVFLLVIHDGKIKEISFVNDFEQSVIMKFENFKKNVRILDSSFKINIPKNFDVIVDK